MTDTIPAHLGPVRGFRTPIRGHAFAAVPPGAHPPVDHLPAQLTREPDNPADPMAVAVWVGTDAGSRWRIGYLDRGVAARLAPRIDAGTTVRARLDGWSAEPDGRWQRPLLFIQPMAPESAGHPAAPGTGDGCLWGRPPGVRRRRVG